MPLNGILPLAALQRENVWVDAARYQDAERQYQEARAQTRFHNVANENQRKNPHNFKNHQVEGNVKAEITLEPTDLTKCCELLRLLCQISKTLPTKEEEVILPELVFLRVSGSGQLERGGRVRSTAPAEDRYIVLSAKNGTGAPTAQQVANLLAASGKQISRKTIARRLRRRRGLYARRPVVCVPLTRQHRTARLQWCREHHNWTEQDWACVLFSDESRFSLSSDCRRQLIWREWVLLIVQKISRKRTDIRHAVSWCGSAS
ncbi:transposable element Tc1 transposase [Trichonephila clavipes]|nr:transposable element Tc1 transposase [Trichonephila clavipes]